MGFPGGSDWKESACNAGDLGLRRINQVLLSLQKLKVYSSLHLWRQRPDEGEWCCRRPSLPWKAGQHPLGWQTSTCQGLYQGGPWGQVTTVWGQPTNPVDEPGARKHPPKVIQPLHSPRQLRALDPEVTWLSSRHLGRRMSWDHCNISSPFFQSTL